MTDDDHSYEEMSDEDYLKNFVSGKELGKDNDRSKQDEDDNRHITSVKANDIEYEQVSMKDLPCGMFYPDGMRISVRAAKVAEIQAYSVVDDRNIYDITEKMNDVLKTCVRVILPNGKAGSYLDVKESDRVYLIFHIRERSFQSGNSLKLDCECDKCGHEYSINMERKHFVKGEMTDELKPYYDSATRMFSFQLNNGDSIQLGLPTIGIQKQFYEYIKEVVKDEKSPNMAYLRTDPFLISNRSKITPEGIKTRIEEFKKMHPDTFQFVTDAIAKIDETFGIKKLESKCPECKEEVHSKMKFPGGASAIFRVHNAFDKFIKK